MRRILHALALGTVLIATAPGLLLAARKAPGALMPATAKPATNRTSAEPSTDATALSKPVASAAVAKPSPDPNAAAVTTVTIERDRPVREKLPTLRFLKANRDFIRARFDHLRQESHVEHAGADAIDPRFVEYRQLLAAIAAGKDSVMRASDARERQGVFTSVEDLARLEHELDEMERLLDAQRTRLGLLQADFAGRQRTELDVLLTGGNILGGRVDSVRVTFEDGTTVSSALNETQRTSIARGGVLEVFRGLVEPRAQVLELALLGEGWSATGHGFVTLDPARDRLTFLKLDLAEARPALGIGSVAATTWLLDTSPQGSQDPSLRSAEATRDRP